jgi:hypothetical protein
MASYKRGCFGTWATVGEILDAPLKATRSPFSVAPTGAEISRRLEVGLYGGGETGSEQQQNSDENI